MNKLILLIMALFLISGIVTSCGKSSSNETNDVMYKLTHTAADAEYILSWDTIVSKCTDIGTYDKQEAFVRRGESAQTIPGGPVLNENSPEAWASYRFIQTAPTGDSAQAFGIFTFYLETDEELDEYVESRRISGFPFQEDGDFMTAVMASGPPFQSVQLYIAGKHFVIVITDVAYSDKSLFFGEEKLMELLTTIKSNISSLEITPLPTGIPARKLTEPEGYQVNLSEVKCNGEEYNLIVKPDNAVVLLGSSLLEQDIAALKSSGLIQEIYEIERKEKALEDIDLNVHCAEFYKNTKLSEGEACLRCKVVYIAGLPSENLDTLLEGIHSYGAYSYQVLSNNIRSRDIILSLTVKFTE